MKRDGSGLNGIGEAHDRFKDGRSVKNDKLHITKKGMEHRGTAFTSNP